MDRIRLKSAKLAGVMKKAGIDLSSSPSSSSSSTDQQQSSTSSSSSAAAALEMGDTRVKRIDRQAAKRFIGHGTGIKFKESSSPPKGGVKRALEASANEISATSTTSSSSLSAEDADIDSKLAEIHRLTTSPSKKNKTS